MSKYEPLGVFLRHQKFSHIPITFDRIEEIIGTKLPNSKRYPAWWSNSTTNNVMTKQWLDAGFQTESVDVEKQKLVFRKRYTSEAAAPKSPEPKGSDKPVKPIFGSMKGMITVQEGYDLTRPTDPNWGRLDD